MTTQKNSYGDSFLYQAFMMRAYKTSRDLKKGIDNSVFLLLDHINQGHYGKPRDYEKQIVKIKTYLAKAVEKVLKWKLSPEERHQVQVYATHAERANDENTLLYAINGLLNATQRFQQY
ncbi:hypothetical protein [Mucilaginibacter sp. OK098]|uniref:hypothetical protein n=1 Tax=Mucilaginibacter sp. OK098 TaxID=1855297 RepID=UPI0009113338|nr:hypothetical protein [Mucilaginibacter sp. OK098]SHL97215.1 hypothetical protein SAMN05216524_101372 [Mucilaginibacter sp. OK098]